MSGLPPVLLVALGGAVGSAARYGMSVALDTTAAGRSFPWATLLVNVIGSAVLGVVVALVQHFGEREYAAWYYLLGVGMCGGFTTFSTFERDAYRLVEQGRLVAMGLYLTLSVVLGYGGYLAATAAAVRLLPPR